ncbi:hypothetical protein BH20PSE1_BH20PSE1_01380 [soil metagenome]
MKRLSAGSRARERRLDVNDLFAAILAVIPGIAKAAEAIASATDPSKRAGQLKNLLDSIIDLQANIGTVQAQNFSLIQQVQELEAECMRLRDWSAEKAQYALVEFSTGMFAQVQKDNKEPMKSAHKFCSACFDNGKKTLLQMQSGEHRRRGLFCPTCKTTLWLYHNTFSDEP